MYFVSQVPHSSAEDKNAPYVRSLFYRKAKINISPDNTLYYYRTAARECRSCFGQQLHLRRFAGYSVSNMKYPARFLSKWLPAVFSTYRVSGYCYPIVFTPFSDYFGAASPSKRLMSLLILNSIEGILPELKT